MFPPSADSGPLSDVFKAKVTSLIQEQLKPIVTELAAQQQTLLSNLALLKYNHNVNDYQMTRLENIRNLEQSINFKVTGALGFDSWQHPSMGTNLREPVPADPLKIPRFMPIDQATPAERAVESASLIKEAGLSARRLDVPLTMHDFPREPVEDVDVDTMHSSVPLFGLGAPRWRQIEGLPPHDIPGTASYDGVLAKPRGNKGLQGWDGRARLLRKPLCKLIEEGAHPYGIDAPSRSSIRNSGTRLLDALDVPARRSSLGDPPSTPTTTTGSRSRRSDAARPSSSSAPPRTGLSRTSTMATIGSITTSMPRPPPLRRCSAMIHIGGPTPENADCTVATLQSAFSDARSAVNGAAAAATENDMINTRAGGDVDVNARSTSASTSTTSLRRTSSTTATIGSPPPPPSDVSRTAVTATTAKIAKAKAKAGSASKVKAAKAKTGATGSAAQKKQQQQQQRATKRRSATATATTATASGSSATLASPSPPAELEQPKARPTKRGRRAAELDATGAEDDQHQRRPGRLGEQGKDTTTEQGIAEPPPPKRRKRAAAPSPSPSICRAADLAVAVKVEEAGGGDDLRRASLSGRVGAPAPPARRSTRVTRASAVVAAAATQPQAQPVPVPALAQRGQATKGKKAKTRKAKAQS